MQGQHADRPARHHGRVGTTRHQRSRIAPFPRHPRQPHREDSQLFSKGQERVWIQGRKLCHLPYQGEPDATCRGGNHLSRQEVQPRSGGWFQAGAPCRHRRTVPERLAHHLQRLQGRELHRTGLARTEDGQAHLHRGGETQRARHHRQGGEETQREAKHRHSHQTGFLRLRQMGGERWRCL